MGPLITLLLFDPVKGLPIPLRADIDDRLGWVEGHEKNLLAALGL